MTNFKLLNSIVMKTFCLILICLFAGLLVEAQGSSVQNEPVIIRPKVMKLVREIAKENILNGAYIDLSKKRNKQFKRYKRLNKISTNAELVILTDNENPVVRSYAFWALSNRPKLDLLPILQKHLYDTTKCKTHLGCFIYEETVGDLYIETYIPEFVYGKLTPKADYKKEFIDSVLLNDKSIILKTKYDLLLKIKPEPKYYSRVKEIATTENSPESILALARYQNPDDVEILKELFKKNNFGYYSIYAIREFPDTRFYPILVRAFVDGLANKDFDYQKWRILFQALAKYPSNETLKLFNDVFLIQNKDRLETLTIFLKISLNKYPNQIFESLKDKLKLEPYQISQVSEQMNFEE